MDEKLFENLKMGKFENGRYDQDYSRFSEVTVS